MKPDIFLMPVRDTFKILCLFWLVSIIFFGIRIKVFAAEGVPVRHFFLPVPDELITDDSTYWTISTLPRPGYQRAGSRSAKYNNMNLGGMMAKFKFSRDGKFLFLLYDQTNKHGVNRQTRTEVEGDVEFIRDSKGQSLMITRAKKGVYRIFENGNTTSTGIPKNELEAKHSSTYLWEITMFGNDGRNLYLLLVDLQKHPGADVDHPSTIDPAWISIYKIPVQDGKMDTPSGIGGFAD